MQLWLIRHGQTAWSKSGRHTGRTDIPLSPQGEREAELLRDRLAARRFALVLTSPLRRALDTCRIAGYADEAIVDADLSEWDYGQYEGRTSTEICAERPGWTLFTAGVPGGESVAQVGARVDRVIARVRSTEGDVAVFAHGHLLKVLAARWLGLPAPAGRYFALGTASLSILGDERGQPVIEQWNDLRHLHE
jgi:broad specificity phosphatase PhoE